MGSAVFATGLAGCGSTPLETFDLGAASGFKTIGRARGQIAVDIPEAGSPLDSDRVIVRPTRETLATLKGAQWPEPLPLKLQTSLVRSFENSKLLAHVGRSGDAMNVAATLQGEIRHFEIDIETSEGVVELSMRLVSERSGRILAARVFSARVAGSAQNGVVASAALNEALTRVLRDIVVWAAAAV